ncbi:UNVERIFIED_CONTAM: hh [Trichonephila clavipes]
MFPPHLALHFAFAGTLLLEVFISASACAPSFFSRRRGTRTGSPLVYKEHIPSTVEFSYAASGPPQGKITRHDPEFRDLILNYSKDVVFKDDEGDASDRVMSVVSYIIFIAFFILK